MELVMKFVIGLVVIVLGVLNWKGNISLLHSYHVKRVKEEDIRPFGKKMGIGTIILGCTVMLASAAELFLPQSLSHLINIILIAGFIPGFAFIFYALFKYNKGIF